MAVADSAEGRIFAHPVGPEAPGYRREIRRPMDLGTVADKLLRGAYTTPGESSDQIDGRNTTPASHNSAFIDSRCSCSAIGVLHIE